MIGMFLIMLSADLEIMPLSFLAVYLLFTGARDWARSLSPIFKQAQGER